MTDATPVFIHTRDRLPFLLKTVPAWDRHRTIGRIILVIEQDDYWVTRRFLKEHHLWDRVEIIRLAQRNAGMGNARNQALRWATRANMAVMVMSDDDIMPKATSDVEAWLKFAGSGDTVGVGVCMPIYGLTLGNAFIRDTCEPVPVSGSWGYGVFALNVGLANEVGGFDRRLVCGWEDQELCRYGIKAGYSWHVHTGVVGANLGKRYAPGGIAALYTPEERAAREKMCHQYIYDRWGGRYISDPSTKAYRCNWRRFREDHGLPRIGPKRS